MTLVLPAALRPLSDNGRQHALRAALGHFSRLVGPLLLLVVISGIYNALNYFDSPADLDSGYGRTLGVKLLLIAPVALLGLWQRMSLRGDKLRHALRWLRLEALLMLALLMAVAWLSATPLPEPAIQAAEIPAPRATKQVGGYQVTAVVSPGGPGVNTYDILIEGAVNALADARIRLQLAHPARDWRGEWLPAERVESSLYVAAGDEIDRAGEWWLLADISAAETTMRAAFRWDIDEAASIIATRPPKALHLGLLAGIAALLLHIVYPRLRRVVAALRLTPASLIIAAFAIVVSAGVMVAGAWMIAERQREYELTLSPPPAVVNTVLPDAESLAVGMALFEERCAGWHDESSDFESLLRRLDSSRDEFVYAALVDGWRGLPACLDDLPQDMRWHVVNYLRALPAQE